MQLVLSFGNLEVFFFCPACIGKVYTVPRAFVIALWYRGNIPQTCEPVAALHSNLAVPSFGYL